MHQPIDASTPPRRHETAFRLAVTPTTHSTSRPDALILPNLAASLRTVLDQRNKLCATSRNFSTRTAFQDPDLHAGNRGQDRSTHPGRKGRRERVPAAAHLAAYAGLAPLSVFACYEAVPTAVDRRSQTGRAIDPASCCVGAGIRLSRPLVLVGTRATSVYRRWLTFPAHKRPVVAYVEYLPWNANLTSLRPTSTVRAVRCHGRDPDAWIDISSQASCGRGHAYAIGSRLSSSRLIAPDRGT
jgi:hypothetical protein